MTHKKNGKPTKTYKSVFRDCEKNDFYNGVKDNVIKGRFCPDTKTNEEFYEVKNGYTNETERKSFSIEV